MPRKIGKDANFNPERLDDVFGVAGKLIPQADTKSGENLSQLDFRLQNQMK